MKKIKVIKQSGETGLRKPDAVFVVSDDRAKWLKKKGLVEVLKEEQKTTTTTKKKTPAKRKTATKKNLGTKKK